MVGTVHDAIVGKTHRVATERRMRSSIDCELHAQLHELAHALEHLVVSSTTLQHSHAVVQLKK